jgi:hypothetical protein
VLDEPLSPGTRPFEPELLPLVRTMHAEAEGQGPVITMRQQKWWAADLRKHLEAAGIQREALYSTDDTARRASRRRAGNCWNAEERKDARGSAERAAALALRAHSRHAELVFCSPGGAMLTRGATKWPLRRAVKAAGLRAIGWHITMAPFCTAPALRGAQVAESDEHEAAAGACF